MSDTPNNHPDPVTPTTDAISVDPDITQSSAAIPAVGTDDPSAVSAREQRAELADTMDALAAKLDVRERARATAVARTNEARQQLQRHRTTVVAGTAGAVLGAALLVTVRHRNRKRDNRGTP